MGLKTLGPLSSSRSSRSACHLTRAVRRLFPPPPLSDSVPLHPVVKEKDTSGAVLKRKVCRCKGRGRALHCKCADNNDLSCKATDFF